MPVNSNLVTPEITPVAPSVSGVSPTSGPVLGGETITVTGSGFGSGMGVTLGGTAVTPLAIKPGSFQFVAPAKAGGYQALVVSNAVGSSVANPASGLSYTGLGSYVALTPFRILDTRAATCMQCGSGGLGAGQTRTVQITGVSGLRVGPDVIPNNATAVVLNVTAVGSSTNSLLTVFPTGIPRPTASNLNFGKGGAIANLVTVRFGQTGPSDSNREVNIFNALGNVDVVADVEGYFAPQAASNPSGEFHSISPLRVCDTRAGLARNTCNQGRLSDNLLGPAEAVKVNVTGVPSGVSGAPGSIPGDGSAGAVVLNLTAVAGTKSTFMSVYPTDSNGNCSTSVGASNINVGPGQKLRLTG